ncbi:heparin lyase I family protein [Microbacterium sp. NPDC056052]|uniref:heparin lyase I family protein n=1 Tax=Microbacterium sp. NPDC056052 TaxID=3345695 RepID=UPI0035D6B3AE
MNELSPEAVAALVAGGAFVGGVTEPLPISPTFAILTDRTARLDSAGHMIYERGATNLYANALLFGGVKGVIGSGGVFPTGMNYYLPSGWIYEILDAPGDGTLTVRVTRPAGNSTGRGRLTFIPSAGYQAFGISGSIVGSFVTEVLEVTDPAGAWLYEFPELQKGEQGGTAGTPSNTLRPLFAGTTGVPVRHLVQTTVTATQHAWMFADLYFSSTVTSATTTVTLKLSEFQMQEAAGGRDRTSWFAGTRRSVAVSVPLTGAPDGAYDVFVAGEPTGRWLALTSSQGLLQIPMPDVGSQAITGVYVFKTGLTSTQKSDAADALDPVEYERARTGNRYLYVNEGNVAAADVTRRFIASQPEGGWASDGVGALPAEQGGNSPVPYAYMRARNRNAERFEFRAGDRSNADTTSNHAPGYAPETAHRAELMVDTGNGGVEGTDWIPDEQDVWISYWLMVERQAITPQAGGWYVFGQMHCPEGANNAGGQHVPPPLNFGFDMRGVSPTAATLSLVQRSLLFPLPNPSPVPATGPNSMITKVSTDPVELAFGTWTHMLFKIRHSQTGGGTVSAWRDGRQWITDKPGYGYNLSGFANGGKMGHFQHGLYTSATDRRQAAHYSGLRWGTTDLSAYVGAPPPRA